MTSRNFTVRIELVDPSTEKLVQVDDILMTMEFVGFATKKDTDQGWLFRLPTGLYFGQSELSANEICTAVSTRLQDHQLACRAFVSEVVDWSGTEIIQATA